MNKDLSPKPKRFKGSERCGSLQSKTNRHKLELRISRTYPSFIGPRNLLARLYHQHPVLFCFSLRDFAFDLCVHAKHEPRAGTANIFASRRSSKRVRQIASSYVSRPPDRAATDIGQQQDRSTNRQRRERKRKALSRLLCCTLLPRLSERPLSQATTSLC